MNGAIHKVIRMINLDLTRTWTVEMMAELAGMTPKYFAVLFKRVVLMTPNAYVKNVRMQSAAKQLSDPDCVLSIKEIARLVGCNDESHFTKDFKSHTSKTPSDFRQNAMEKFQAEYDSARNRTFRQETSDLAKE